MVSLASMDLLSFALGLSLAPIASAVGAGAAVPQAVQRAVGQIFGDAKVVIETEHEGGTVHYEAGATTRLDVVFSAKGSVEEIEVELPLGLVPPAVLAAARGALDKGAKLTEAELLIRGPRVLYELEARAGSDEIELVISPEGRIVSQRSEQDERDDD